MCELLDEDRDGRLCMEDMMKAFHSIKLTIPFPHVQIIVSYLDSLGDGNIPYHSVLEELSKPRRLVGKTNVNHQDAKHGGKGQIPFQLVEYVKRILCDHGIMLREEIEMCLKRYDSNTNKKKASGYIPVNMLWACLASVAPDIRLSLSEQELLIHCCKLKEGNDEQGVKTQTQILISDFVNLLCTTRSGSRSDYITQSASSSTMKQPEQPSTRAYAHQNAPYTTQSTLRHTRGYSQDEEQPKSRKNLHMKKSTPHYQQTTHSKYLSTTGHHHYAKEEMPPPCHHANSASR